MGGGGRWRAVCFQAAVAQVSGNRSRRAGSGRALAAMLPPARLPRSRGRPCPVVRGGGDQEMPGGQERRAAAAQQALSMPSSSWMGAPSAFAIVRRTAVIWVRHSPAVGNPIPGRPRKPSTWRSATSSRPTPPTRCSRAHTSTSASDAKFLPSAGATKLKTSPWRSSGTPPRASTPTPGSAAVDGPNPRGAPGHHVRQGPLLVVRGAPGRQRGQSGTSRRWP